MRFHTCLRQRVAEFIFQLALWKKNIFFGVDTVVKTNWYVFYRSLHSYQQRLRVITLFPNIFSYCFCILSEFAKGFERKIWRVQVAHLHNAARALSRLSRCFQLSANLDRDFFRYLWYCGKNQSVRRLAWHWWISTDLGLCINWHVFLPLRM